ncbi:MAG: hypothetical protein ACRCTZ_21325 [Sarcina sp.]
MTKPSGVLGNSIDIHVGKNDCSAEIRADVKVSEFESKRIWGQVLNCRNEPVPNSLVKLVRVICQGNRKYYEGVAHTITDCEGFYQFDVCDNSDNECYKIIINKAVTGQELVIDTQGGNCGACTTSGGYNPCLPYNPIVKPYDPNECDCNCYYQPVNPCPPVNPCQPTNSYNPCYSNKQECGCEDNYPTSPCKKNAKTNYATYTR